MFRLLLVLVLAVGLSDQRPEDQTSVSVLGRNYGLKEHINSSKEKKFHLHYFNKVNWYQAMLTCHAMNMKFASINNQQEFDILLNMINETNLKTQFWLSATDLGEKGTYMWASYGTPVAYTSWNTNEPNHVVLQGEMEHCIEVAPFNSAYKMNNCMCSDKKYFVCEYY